MHKLIEKALGDLSVKYTRAYATLYPEVGASWAAVGDGFVCFAGQSSPLSRATALGLEASVEESHVRFAEEFLASRGSTPMVDASPARDPSLHAILEQRGYRASHRLNLYWRGLDDIPAQEPSQADSPVRISPLDRDDPRCEDLWTLTVGQGFAGAATGEPPYMDIYRAIFRAEGTIAFLAESGGVPKGGAALKISGKVAVLSTASTIPQFRRSGIQSELLRARLQAAREAGCEIAVVQATPGSDSERNILRAGFSLTYQISDMVLRQPPRETLITRISLSTRQR